MNNSLSSEGSYYPASNGYTLAYDGVAGPDNEIGYYNYTWENELTDYTGEKSAAGEAYVILNFSHSFQNFGGLNYSVMHGAYNDDDGNSELWIYDWVNDEWVYLGDGGQGTGGWTNGSISGSKYSEDSEILIMSNSTDSDGGAGVAVQIAWLEPFAGPPWLSGYNYRTEVYLNASAGAGTNYVMKWKVLYDGGSDIGSYIYCTKHCQTDFGDVRWTEDDGITELNYYLDYYIIEAGLGNTYGVFYVQISANLNDTDQLIYIYYGTQGTTTTTSSGANTFSDWLDADDTAGWTKSNMEVTNYGGYLRFYNPTASLNAYARRFDLSYPAEQWRMLIRMKTISIGAVDRANIYTLDDTHINCFSDFFAPNYGDQTHFYYWSDSGETQGLSWNESYEYVIRITVDEDDSADGVQYRIMYSNGWTSHGLYHDNKFRSGSPVHADGIQVTDASSSTYCDARIKYFAIMKNVATEPFVKDYGLNNHNLHT